jgi:transcriptional regulator with XRE-family HTH domain
VSIPGAADERGVLARRLRDLRFGHWPGRTIKQADLGQAIGVTPAAISSWENGRKVPPEAQLRSYATFFATERSVAARPYRLLEAGDLDQAERAGRETLERELLALRDLAAGDTATADAFRGSGIWYFPDGGDVTIVCTKLPAELTASMPYTDPTDPDYVALYGYADPDALLELHGHVRANNPYGKVTYRAGDVLAFSQYNAHLAVLGGVDFNPNTQYFIDQANIPVRQLPRDVASDPGGFAVGDQVFRPTLRPYRGQPLLVEDICHIARTPHPYNVRRTLTICNASYGRGTLGAVLAFTDHNVRDENESYVRQRFPGAEKFSILARVRIGGEGLVVSPRLTDPGVVLHTWP